MDGSRKKLLFITGMIGTVVILAGVLGRTTPATLKGKYIAAVTVGGFLAGFGIKKLADRMFDTDKG
jgi:hypothetical protein